MWAKDNKYNNRKFSGEECPVERHKKSTPEKAEYGKRYEPQDVRKILRLSSPENFFIGIKNLVQLIRHLAS
jgi:hypothetical protein